jgi:hypothetical protein
MRKLGLMILNGVAGVLVALVIVVALINFGLVRN